MVLLVRRGAVALWLGGVIALVLWLCWRSRQDAALRFLPQSGTAEWITYPNPPDLLAHPITNSSSTVTSVFRRTFFADANASVRLEVRALEGFSVRVNGAFLSHPLTQTRNWKDPTTFAVGPALVSGTNVLEVIVTNRAGPPLLWVELTGTREPIVSDRTWEVSCSEAVWRNAHVAREPRPLRRGNPMFSEKGVAASVRGRAWTHAALLGLAILITVVARRWAANRQLHLTPREARWMSLAALVALWVILFLHNVGHITVRHGFDSTSHLNYIKMIQDRHALPAATEGWETHQPPLFYAVAAALLEIVQWDATTPSGVTLLRVLSMLFGVGQILLVFAALRLLFPNELKRPLLGAAMATLLPAHIYHAHYVTNETFVALLVSGVFYLTLRVLRSERFTPWWPLALGACLGAALLSKLTALLVVPAVFASLAVKAMERRADWRRWLGTIAFTLGACVLVAGWYYWPLWQSGRLWEPSRWAYGTGWWQEDGYRTAAYYWRGGDALVRPLFSGSHSFWDGLYSTLWGDGLCGGATSVEFAPPWNYELLAAGYWLAIAPSALVLAGLGVALWTLLRRPSLEWFVLLGVALLFLPALFYFSLVAPGTSQVRASFGLVLLVPFCAFFALGFGRVTSTRRATSCLAVTAVVLWALNSFVSHWVPPSSAQAQLSRARMLLEHGYFQEAAREAEAGLQRNPAKAALRSILADAWTQLGRTNEARLLVQHARAQWPNDPLARLDVAFDLTQAGHRDEALAEISAAIDFASDHLGARRELVLLLAKQERFAEAERACREALRVSPYDRQLRAWLDDLRAGKAPSDLPSRK